MILSAGKKYYIDIGQTNGMGSVWTVRLYKRVLVFRKRLSSDWFLNEEQARKFGEQLSNELNNGTSVESVLLRKPGWTLHRPPH